MSTTSRAITSVRHELTPRLLAVQRTERLSPRMLRVTVAGDDLAGFSSLSPSDHIKLCFPAPGVERPVMSMRGPDGIIPPPADGPKPVMRDYTVRAHRADLNEMDIDFVMHGSGPAVVWAEEAEAQPGRLLGVLGPRGSRVVPNDFDWYLFAGDETALPAIGRWVSELSARSRVIAVIEVENAAEEQLLESPAQLEVIWKHRDGGAEGESTAVLDTIRGLTLPDGEGYIWAAGEAGMLRPIRRYLLNELQHNSDWVSVDGYWKRGVANRDHHAPLDDDE